MENVITGVKLTANSDFDGGHLKGEILNNLCDIGVKV
jgi:hypothetical protein